MKHDQGKVYLLTVPGKVVTGLNSQTEEQVAVRLLKGAIEPLDLQPNEDAHYSEILATIAMYTDVKNRDSGIKKDDMIYYHKLLYNGNFALKSALKELRDQKMISFLRNNSEIVTTLFGTAVAQSFMSLKDAVRIRDALVAPITETNPAPDMLLLAQSLHSFDNVYVTNRMLNELSLKNQQRLRSNNLFSTSVLNMVQAGHLGKKSKSRLNRRVYDILITWSENIFNCSHEEAPYCDCGKRNVEGYIFDYRLSGMSIREILEALKEMFEIKVFYGDVVDYLESIIYSLLAIQKIGRSLPVPAQTMMKIRNIREIVKKLIGPRKSTQ